MVERVMMGSWVAVVCCAVLLVVGGCATTSGVPQARSMPDGGTFAGFWYSEQFEHMYLHQDGDRVVGVYAYSAGGTLEGEVNGNLLVFSWHEPGDRSELRQEQSGHGYLQVVMDGDTPELVGEWGYGDDHSGAGPWTAEFIRHSEPTDPRTIEEIKEIH